MLKIENPVKRTITEILNFLIFILLSPLILRKNKFPEKIGKILVLRPDHIGDVVMATSVYREIKKKFPKSKLVVLAGKWGKEVLENNPYIDEIIIHNCPWWEKVRGEKSNYLQWFFSHFLPTVKKIRKENFDIGIDLRGDFRHILFFLFCGRVKYKISYNRSGGEYLLEKAVNYEINNHEIEKNFKLLEEIGIKNLSFEEKRPKIYVEEKEKKKIEEILTKIPEKNLRIIIHPSAGNKLRMWKKENFVEIIRWIKEKYECEIFLVGKEEKIGEAIETSIKDKVENLMGKLSLRETAALIEKCNLFIGNDSSLAHIASCFDIPLLILYGPTQPERCKPYSPHLYYIYHKFPCSPCLQIKCVRRKNYGSGECMERISVEEVKEKIREILQNYYRKISKNF